MERYDIVIVGAGAAGLMAAHMAALAKKRRGESGPVVILEGNPKIGKKLLATGNGRCNMTNLHISPEKYHGDALAARVLEKYPPQRILNEFQGLGLLAVADSEGRVYPRGGQSRAVLDALLPQDQSILPVCNKKVVSIARKENGYLLRTEDGGEYWAKKCVLACGGAASPVHSLGGGYALAKQLGHTVTALSPSLVPLKTSSGACGALKGMRVRAKATLYKNGEKVYSESGEVIFGQGRLSGICMLDLSARLRETGLQNIQVGLDLLEEMSEEEVLRYLTELRSSRPNRNVSELFFGLFNFRVGQELLIDIGLSKEKSLAERKGAALRRAQAQLRELHFLLPEDDRTIADLTGGELQRAARAAKNWRFPIIGPGPWEDAQVTAGGVPLGEIDIDTMESKKCPGLYLAGEILDVDGDCGGYNLHWAWASGLAAGLASGFAAGE